MTAGKAAASDVWIDFSSQMFFNLRVFFVLGLLITILIFFKSRKYSFGFSKELFWSVILFVSVIFVSDLLSPYIRWFAERQQTKSFLLQNNWDRFYLTIPGLTIPIFLSIYKNLKPTTRSSLFRTSIRFLIWGLIAYWFNWGFKTTKIYSSWTVVCFVIFAGLIHKWELISSFIKDKVKFAVSDIEINVTMIAVIIDKPSS